MLSIVIPTINAQNTLPHLLAQISGKIDDIVISDGGSNDKTLSIAIKSGARLAMGCKGRGWQLARGAKWASLNTDDEHWFLFLHADCVLAENWLKAVDIHMKSHPERAGYFKFKLNDTGWRPRFMEFIVALRCRFWQLPYGDQGLLISSSLYQDIGGFPNWDLFEDVKIIEALRGRLRPLKAEIFTDAAKYQQDGYWKRSVKNFKLYRAYKNGAAQENLVKGYYK